MAENDNPEEIGERGGQVDAPADPVATATGGWTDARVSAVAACAGVPADGAKYAAFAPTRA